MILIRYRPRPPLSDFVELLWYFADAAPSHAKERLLPTGSLELVFGLGDDMMRLFDRRDLDAELTYRGALVCGPQSKYFVIDTTDQAEVIGVHFKPGGAYPFFVPPADELRDTHVSLGDLWGPDAAALRDRLLEARTPEAKLRLLERELLARAVRPLARHRAVAFALDAFSSTPHTRTISDVASQTGLSPRRFIEVFSSEVGLTPKLFCRVRRFQDALRRIGAGRRVEWAAVAAACGYYDQAHFIRDFKAFSGINPTDYLERRTEHVNHVPIVG